MPPHDSATPITTTTFSPSHLPTNPFSKPSSTPAKSAFLHRNLKQDPLLVKSAEGCHVILEDGRRVIDATSGAAVSCLGHSNPRIHNAMLEQMNDVAYCLTLMFSTAASEDLAREIIAGTGGLMSRLFVVSSGSEAMDAAMKLARQYFLELPVPEPSRTRFIARHQSYHGTTIGPLSLGGHTIRRRNFLPMLTDNISHVSPCYAYRGKTPGESDESYVARLAQELDDEFQRVGPGSVCAFVAEPVVGAALGCVPSVKGYFPAMKAVCDKYGALLILDEVMCGMGRSGTMHAWQNPTVGVVPDIQTMGKGLGGGYASISGVLAGPKVIGVLEAGTGAFVHGQTYQGHPVACRAALEVQREIREKGLVEQGMRMGKRLERGLRDRLGEHKYVGDIRGEGLFWGIELVKEKGTKEPFDPKLAVGMGIHEKAIQDPYLICIYPGNGTADGLIGDHVLLAPPYIVDEDMVDQIVDRTARTIEDYFEELGL